MKVLILHASAGAGHKSAANAIQKAYKHVLSPVEGTLACPPETRVIDALDFAPSWFRKVYTGSFESSVKHAPWAFGAAYHTSSQAVRLQGFRGLRRAFNRIAGRELVREVKAWAPDVVICTHFMSLDVLAREKKAGRFDAPLACVVTDFVVHGYWVEKLADRYYVAAPESAAAVIARGVAKARVRATGIPVDPAFERPIARETAQRELGMKGDRWSVLVMGGGLGMGPIAEVVKSLGERDLPVQLDVICGKNAALKAEIEALAPTLRVPVRAHGFTDKVRTFMSAADLIVTKPGGLTTSEALAVGRPMLLFEAMPGQEAGNARHHARSGAAIAVAPETAGDALAALVGDPARLCGMAAASRLAGRPDAALAIARDALGLVRVEALHGAAA